MPVHDKTIGPVNMYDVKAKCFVVKVIVAKRKYGFVLMLATQEPALSVPCALLSFCPTNSHTKTKARGKIRADYAHRTGRGYTAEGNKIVMYLLFRSKLFFYLELAVACLLRSPCFCMRAFFMSLLRHET